MKVRRSDVMANLKMKRTSAKKLWMLFAQHIGQKTEWIISISSQFRGLFYCHNDVLMDIRLYDLILNTRRASKTIEGTVWKKWRARSGNYLIDILSFKLLRKLSKATEENKLLKLKTGDFFIFKINGSEPFFCSGCERVRF